MFYFHQEAWNIEQDRGKRWCLVGGVSKSEASRRLV